MTMILQGPPLWPSDQSSWLQVQRFWVRFQVLPDFQRSGGSRMGSTQWLWSRKLRLMAVGDPLCWPHDTLSPQQSAHRSVSMVCLWTDNQEFVFGDTGGRKEGHLHFILDKMIKEVEWLKACSIKSYSYFDTFIWFCDFVIILEFIGFQMIHGEWMCPFTNVIFPITWWFLLNLITKLYINPLGHLFLTWIFTTFDPSGTSLILILFILDLF
jgi:hypothetical protein